MYFEKSRTLITVEDQYVAVLDITSLMIRIAVNTTNQAVVVMLSKSM